MDLIATWFLTKVTRFRNKELKMNLNLTNLSSQQVITILSELADSAALTAIIQMRMRNHNISDEEIIRQLTQAAAKYLA